MTRAEALTLLLTLAPPAALPVERIGHHYTYPEHKGDPEFIKRDLGMAYVQHRRQAYAGGDSVVSVQRRPMVIVRRA